MTNTVPLNIIELLNNVLENDINEYKIVNMGSNGKGEGFLGEMCYVLIENKSTKETKHLVVKQAFTDKAARALINITNIYANEINFYSKIWPEFKKFQISILSYESFNKIPKCLATTSEYCAEKLVFENLKYQNFETFDKRKVFDKSHLEFIFSEYGKFYAISFAYKERDPVAFSNLTKCLHNIFDEFTTNKEFQESMNHIYKICINSLFPGKEDQVIVAFEKYLEIGAELFGSSIKYEGKYSALLHGDCWSNNMMFKYDDNRKLLDMRLLDFQLVKLGTPVCDLSYCFYSGGSKDDFQNLEYYLKLYHNSFSTILRALGCDPEKLFPFDEFKKDWKQHSKFGFIMGLNLLKVKLTEAKNIVDFSDLHGNNEDELMDKWLAAEYDEDTFKERARDLILHMYENDFL